MFYKKRIVRPDTAADISERKKRMAAQEQVHAERAAKWPTITAENFEAVCAWQEARLAELSR